MLKDGEGPVSALDIAAGHQRAAQIDNEPQSCSRTVNDDLVEGEGTRELTSTLELRPHSRFAFEIDYSSQLQLQDPLHCSAEPGAPLTTRADGRIILQLAASAGSLSRPFAASLDLQLPIPAAARAGCAGCTTLLACAARTPSTVSFRWNRLSALAHRFGSAGG